MVEDDQKTDYNQKIIELLSQKDDPKTVKRPSIWAGTNALSKFYIGVPEEDRSDVVVAIGKALASEDQNIQAQAVRWLAETRTWRYDRVVRRLRKDLLPYANEVFRLAVVGYSSTRTLEAKRARNVSPSYETVGSRN